MPDKIIVVGASRGGVSAVKQILNALPPGFDIPLVIALHRDRHPFSSLAERLQEDTSVSVLEAEDKEDIAGSHAYLAPADYHTLVEDGHLALSTEAPVCHARPSIDVLLESAACAYGSGVIALVLSGSSSDGAAGASAVEKKGGTVIVQDPQSAEYKEMPEAAIMSTKQAKALTLEEIASFLQKQILPPDCKRQIKNEQ